MPVLKTFYQIDRWSVGAGFTFDTTNNSVEGLATDVNMNNPVTAATVNNLLAKVKDMNDGFDEYIIRVSVHAS